jgi:hypothetical protein
MDVYANDRMKCVRSSSSSMPCLSIFFINGKIKWHNKEQSERENCIEIHSQQQQQHKKVYNTQQIQNKKLFASLSLSLAFAHSLLLEKNYSHDSE